MPPDPFNLQNLDPESARLCLQTESFCLKKKLLQYGSSLVLAVSGGADSVAMALIFRALARRLNLKLIVMHVDHGLRPESDRDAAFVRKFCEEIDLECAVAGIDAGGIAAREKCGIEEAGRRGRYALLEDLRRERGADYVLVAHHLRDLCEDIIMRLTRGTGWPGLGGMKIANERIRRPLLRTHPDKLKKLILALGFSWIEDESNASLDFRRNRVRNLVLPLLREENPALEESARRLSEMAEIDENYWHERLEETLRAANINIRALCADGKAVLRRELLSGIHPALRLRLYHAILKSLNKSGAAGQPAWDSLLKLDSAFAKGSTAGVFQFSGKIRADLCRKGIVFRAFST